MRDPFPIPPPRALVAATKPLSDALWLQTLPLHAHEVIFALALYTFTFVVVAPFLSRLVVPQRYAKFNRRTKLNWDVHIVSFVQACVINALSLYIIWFDEDRKAWRSREHWHERIWGYYGTGGLCQSFALGYFLWDLVMCTWHVEVFGVGMLAHAMSAVAVFSIGYRPFLYFSAPIFLLYELSSPFLNIHWFCDKLGLTGSIYQAVNGAFLVATFFCCRIVWGLYSSVWVFRDMWWTYTHGHSIAPLQAATPYTVDELIRLGRDGKAQIWAFNEDRYLPIWIPLVYLASNVTLNSLNIFWFGKMIETIRTRFDPPWGTKGVETESTEKHVDSTANARPVAGSKPGSIKEARERADMVTDGSVTGKPEVHRETGADGRHAVEVTGSQRVSARSRRKA